MKASTAWSERDIPDQTGRLAIVTGANSGLGFHTASVLAERGAQLVLAVRDPPRGAAAATQIRRRAPEANLAIQQLDLGSLESVRTAAAELRRTFPRIDLLINNAGVMYPPRSTTADRFELQFGTNHLGHFALTGLLLENMLGVEGARIVVVSSIVHRLRASIRFDDLQWQRRYNRVAAYGQSKLANLMFTYELQRRLTASSAPCTAVAAHPGTSDTELMRHLPRALKPAFSVVKPFITQPPARGALPSLRAATDPAVRGGQFFGPSRFGQFTGHPVVVRSSKRAHDVDHHHRLWVASEELTGVTYPV